MIKNSSKVNVLNTIKKKLSFINIPQYIFFTKNSFEINKRIYLDKIKKNLKKTL